MNLIDYIEQTKNINQDPAGLTLATLEPLEALVTDKDYDLSFTNPAVICIQAAACAAAAHINEAYLLYRKTYPELAESREDLYSHLTNEDLVGVYSEPASAKFYLALSLDELKRSAVDTSFGYRKVVLPKDTTITVDGYSFMLSYPIEIRILQSDGIRVLYNTDDENPLTPLISNVVEHKIVRNKIFSSRNRSVEALILTLDVLQLRKVTYFDALIESTGFLKKYAITRKFHYLRVWTSDGDSEWSEIKVTQSTTRYDKNEPTAILKVLDGQISVEIPRIYFSNGLIDEQIKIEVYTTIGEIDLDLGKITPDEFTIEWLDDSKYEDPANEVIRNVQTKHIFSDIRVTGGKNGISTQELKQRIIDRSTGKSVVPVTPQQLKNNSKYKGFDLVKKIDTLTKRLYIATRGLTAPLTSNIKTPIGTSVSTLHTSLDNILGFHNVSDNGSRVTINAGSYFKNVNGELLGVDTAEMDYINSLSPEAKVNLFLDNEYQFNPFHYVIDMTGSDVDLRPYYLNSPTIKNKFFIEENESINYDITTLQYAIEKVDTGYNILIFTAVSDLVKKIDGITEHLKLEVGFTSVGITGTAGTLATYVGDDDSGNMVYMFSINTNYDLNSDHQLIIDNFKILDNDERLIELPLETTITLKYMIDVDHVGVHNKSNIDQRSLSFLYATEHVGITEETLEVNFGIHLSNLWAASRSNISTSDYRVYEEDVYATYTINEGSMEMVDGELTYVIEHYAGDVVTDELGDPKIKHAAGDTYLDVNGNPVIENEKTIVRKLSLCLLEGSFGIATTPDIENYVKSSIIQLATWSTTGIASIANSLYEDTSLMFHPKENLSQIKILTQDGTIETIAAKQSMRVRYYLSDKAYKQKELRSLLEDLAKNVIISEFSKTTISILNIESLIKEQAGDDIISVKISGIDNDNYPLVSIVEDVNSLSISKRPVLLTNGNITVEDDVTFEWVKHT